MEEINAKTQGCKDAKVVDLPQRSLLFGRNKRKDARAQRRKGSGSPAEIPAVSVVDHSGCFIEGTVVTVSSLPGQSTSMHSLWSYPSWLDEPSQETPWLAPERYASVATRTELLVPIESVPIGSRVPTKNPNRFEVDPQPEPDQATWAWPAWTCWVLMALSRPSPERPSTLCGQSIARNGCRWLS